MPGSAADEELQCLASLGQVAQHVRKLTQSIPRRSRPGMIGGLLEKGEKSVSGLLVAALEEPGVGETKTSLGSVPLGGPGVEKPLVLVSREVEPPLPEQAVGKVQRLGNPLFGLRLANRSEFPEPVPERSRVVRRADLARTAVPFGRLRRAARATGSCSALAVLIRQ